MSHVLRSMAVVAGASLPGADARACESVLEIFPRAVAAAPCGLLTLASHFCALVLHASECSAACEGALGVLSVESVRTLGALMDEGATYVELLRAMATLRMTSMVSPSVADMEGMEETLALLSLPLHVLLCTGGDDRMKLSRSPGNRYGAVYHAVTEGDLLQRSSCTASSPSLAATVKAERRRFALLADVLRGTLSGEQANAQEADAVRGAILSLLSLPPSTSCTLTPSGTDAVLLVVSLVHAEEARSPHPAPIVSVVCGDGELGGGTVAACRLAYFTHRTPSGVTRRLGAPLVDAERGVFLTRAFSPRAPDGRPWDHCTESTAHVESAIAQAIADAAASGQRVILHAVQCSKTGLRMPSVAFLRRLKDEHGPRLAIAADCCQLRGTEDDIAALLALDAFVLVTGSKFLGGPAFSGAVLTRLAWEVDGAALVRGLGDFVCAYDVSARSALHACLPQRSNLGLLFRWWVALVYASQRLRLADIPTDERIRIIAWWRAQMERLVAQCGHVEVLAEDAEPSILAFRIVHKGVSLTLMELRAVYTLLQSDVSAYVPIQHAELAETPVYVGQPVALGNCAALRIALSAGDVVALSQTHDLTCELRIFAKLCLILDYVPLSVAVSPGTPSAQLQ